jgi:murein L,D-transpeptidase YafK
MMKQFKQRKTIIISTALLILFANTSFEKKKTFKFSNVTNNTYRIVVEKSAYELNLFDSTGELLITYPVVFGSKDLGDKLIEGDRRTPEGVFHIVQKRKHEKWDHMMLIDYPTPESIQKFNDRKAKGIIPKNAKIGGGIGIHGTWPDQDFTVDIYQNWTQGCISTKNEYIQDLYKILPVGTRVEIKR